MQVATYWHFFASNQLFIFGEIINTGNEAVTPRPIEALFFDKDGTYLDGIPLSVPRNHLPPGEMACFGGPLDGPFFKPPDGWAYFVLEQPEFFPGDLPPAVTIISHQGMYNPVDKSYRVSGSVRNDQAADLHNVRMAVTVYDSLNQVTGCSAVHLNQTTLAAAEVGYFSMRFGSIYRDRGNIHRYRLQVD